MKDQRHEKPVQMFAQSGKDNSNPYRRIQKGKEGKYNQGKETGAKPIKMRLHNSFKLRSDLGKPLYLSSTASIQRSDVLPKSGHKKATLSRKRTHSTQSNHLASLIPETPVTRLPTSQVAHKELQQNTSPSIPSQACSGTEVSSILTHLSNLDNQGSLSLQQGPLDSILKSEHPSNMVQGPPLAVGGLTLSPEALVPRIIPCAVPCSLPFSPNQPPDEDAVKHCRPSVHSYPTLSTYSTATSTYPSNLSPRVHSENFTQENRIVIENVTPGADESASSCRSVQPVQEDHTMTGLIQQASPSLRSNSEPFIIDGATYSNGGMDDGKRPLPMLAQPVVLHSEKYTKQAQLSAKAIEHVTRLSKGAVTDSKKYPNNARSLASIRSQKSDVVFIIEDSKKGDDNSQTAAIERDNTHNLGLCSSIAKGPLINPRVGKQALRLQVSSSAETNNGVYIKMIGTRQGNCIHQKSCTSAKEVERKNMADRKRMAAKKHGITQSPGSRTHKDLNGSHTKQGRSLTRVACPSTIIPERFRTASKKSKREALPSVDHMSTLSSSRKQFSITSYQRHLSCGTSSYTERPCAKFLIVSFALLFSVKLMRVVHKGRRIISLETIDKPHAAYTIQCAWRRYRQRRRVAFWRAARFLGDWLRFKLSRLWHTRGKGVRMLHQVLVNNKNVPLVHSTCQEIHLKATLDMITRRIKCFRARKVLLQLRIDRDERNIAIQNCYQASLRIYRDERSEFLDLVKEAERILHIHPQAPVLQWRADVLGHLYCVPVTQDGSELETKKTKPDSSLPKTRVEHMGDEIVNKSSNTNSQTTFIALKLIKQTSMQCQPPSEAESTMNGVTEAVSAVSSVSFDQRPMWRQCRHESLIFLNDKRKTSPPEGSLFSIRSAPCVMRTSNKTLSSEGCMGPDIDSSFLVDPIGVDVNRLDVQVKESCDRKCNFPLENYTPVDQPHSDSSLKVTLPFWERNQNEDHALLNELFHIETDAYLDVKLTKNSKWTNMGASQVPTQRNEHHYAQNSDNIDTISDRNASALFSQYANREPEAHSPSLSMNLTQATHGGLEGSPGLAHHPAYLHYIPSTPSNHDICNNISAGYSSHLPLTSNDYPGCKSEDVLDANVELLVRIESIERKALTREMLDAHAEVLSPVQRLNVAFDLCSSATVSPFFASLLLSMKDELFMRRAVKLFAEEHKQRITITELYDSLPLRFLLRPPLSSTVERRRKKLVEHARTAHDPLVLAEEKHLFLSDTLSSINAVRQGMVIKPRRTPSTLKKDLAEEDFSDPRTLTKSSAEGIDQDTVRPNRGCLVVKMALRPHKVNEAVNTGAIFDISDTHNTDSPLEGTADTGIAMRSDRTGESIKTNAQERTPISHGLSVSTAKSLDVYLERARKKRCAFFRIKPKVTSVLPHLVKKNVESCPSNGAPPNSMRDIVAKNTVIKNSSDSFRLPDINGYTYGGGV